MVSSRARKALRHRRYAVLPAVLVGLVVAGAPTVAGASTTSGTEDPAVTSSAPPSTGGTSDDAAVTSAAPSDAPQTQAEARPRPLSLTSPLGQVADGPVPDAATLTEEISDELDSDWLGPKNRRAVTVRDALSGAVLAEANADRLVTPASTTKILSAAAIVTGLPIDHTFTTRVVRGATPQDVVLVAGGDMLLARGEGDPDAVAGHAGVADLAAQTAAALEERAVTGPVNVQLDLQHVAGPHRLETWSEFWISEGYAGRIVQLGLEEDRALPFWPSPRDPEQEVARAFVQALLEEGVEVAGAEAGEDDDSGDAGQDGEGALDGWTADEVTTPAGAQGFVDAAATTSSAGSSADSTADSTAGSTSGSTPGSATGSTDDAGSTSAPGVEVLASVESATVRDDLALALATSDNAMVEQLARQAAVADGASADQAVVTDWIRTSVEQDYGVDLTDMQLADASGLSDGTRLTVDAIADVLVAGADGSHPPLQAVLAAGGLPIAGYTGTLAERFHLPVHAAAIGNARAKTGSLPGVTSLAGVVVTEDGRLLVYSMTADKIGEDGAVLEARSSLDEIVAQLARCGC